MKPLPVPARLYIFFMAMFAIVCGLLAIANCEPSIEPEALALCVCAIISSGLKIRMPACRSTISVNFVFLLLASLQLCWHSAMLIGLVSVLVQYGWHSNQKRQLVKLGFNCGSIFMSITAASAIFNAAWLWPQSVELPIRVIAAAMGYFLVNTVTVGIVMGLSAAKPVFPVWRDNLAWSLPHYLTGGILIAAYIMLRPVTGWQTCALVIPILWMLYRTNRLYATRFEAEQRTATLKAQFLANMSHEIRTPMNAVVGLTALLLDEPDLPVKHKQSIDLIRQASSSLLTIIDDILDISALESGELRITPQPVDLHSLTDEMQSILQLGAHKRELRFAIERTRDVPRWVVVDGGRLRQILFNLCGNAMKFTAEGSVTVRVSALPDGGRLRFEVADTGIGIPQERIKDLFQPFTQVDTSDRRAYGGTGLGLSICKKLVHGMGGEIGVISKQGCGSTFWFHLPLEEAQPPQQAHESRATTAPPASPLKPTKGHVLVVEDNLLNQRVAVRVLDKLGYTSDVAEDGMVAVEMVRNNSYAVVLMDCQMPNMDGFEATRAIRRLAIGGKTPIVALTAGALHADEARCREAGMDGFLTKPIDIMLLAQALEKSCSQPPAIDLQPLRGRPDPAKAGPSGPVAST